MTFTNLQSQLVLPAFEQAFRGKYKYLRTAREHLQPLRTRPRWPARQSQTARRIPGSGFSSSWNTQVPGLHGCTWRRAHVSTLVMSFGVAAVRAWLCQPPLWSAVESSNKMRVFVEA